MDWNWFMRIYKEWRRDIHLMGGSNPVYMPSHSKKVKNKKLRARFARCRK